MSSVSMRGGRVVHPPGEKGREAPGAGDLGLAIFLASLSMLFAAAIVAYLVIRSGSEVWPPPGSPELPWALWLSTGALLGASICLELGLARIRKGDTPGLLRMLYASIGCAVIFCGTQAWNWWSFAHADIHFERQLYGFTFFMLTGLHALHIIGGLVALGVVTVFAVQGRYSWAFFPGVRLSARYWHFLGVMWLILFGLLLFDS